ncbi:hypothetical protein [Treponema pectinovorum]|uniref:hypothetical protein n=1 Tax=Treponema pectinovorum TaxID=164 RepID=UPI0011CCD563|nr:hypothetical protein [Treponema pectinovorum]
MGRKKKIYKKADILEAIRGSGGIITTVALALNCDWHTAKVNIDKYEETREAFNGELETGLDLVEGKAYAQAKNGDGAMIRFILSTKGRHRGYGELPIQPIEDVEDTELKIEIVDGNDDD